MLPRHARAGNVKNVFGHKVSAYFLGVDATPLPLIRDWSVAAILLKIIYAALLRQICDWGAMVT
jgi:hypothetical protein